MSGVQSIEERVAELLRVRDLVDAELARLHYASTPARKRPRSVVPDCGTETGYQRHKHRGETCDPCKAAHAQHERVAAIARRTRRTAA